MISTWPHAGTNADFGAIHGLVKGDATMKTTKAVRFGTIAMAAVTGLLLTLRSRS